MGDRYLKLRFVAEGSRQRRAIVCTTTGLKPDEFARLNRLGAHLIDRTVQSDFTRRVQAYGDQRKTFDVVLKVGWHGDHFLLPGREVKGVWLYVEDDYAKKYRQSGTLEGWQEVARLARGNTRMVLALSLAFVGPLNGLLSLEPIGIQLLGEGSIGKTSVAVAAGSVWGRHADEDKANALGFGEYWNNTANHLEAVALAHTKTLLVLDETKVRATGDAGRGDTFLKAVTRLLGGFNRGRHLDPENGRSWWLALLSTSNQSLDELAAKDGDTIDEAFRGRLIDVPAPVIRPGRGDGIFERLGAFPTRAEMSRRLHKLSAEHFGVAGYRFVQRIEKRLAAGQRQKLVRFLEARREAYIGSARRLDPNGRDLTRVHQKFATIYAAGCLAANLGVLPLKRKQLKAALLDCERAHIGGVQVVLDPSQTLAEALRTGLRNRTLVLSSSGAAKAAAAAQVFTHGEGEKREYLLTHQTLKDLTGDSSRKVVKALKTGGILVVGKAGKQGTRDVVKRKIGGKCVSVIALRADQFDAAVTDLRADETGRSGRGALRAA